MINSFGPCSEEPFVCLNDTQRRLLLRRLFNMDFRDNEITRRKSLYKTKKKKNKTLSECVTCVSHYVIASVRNDMATVILFILWFIIQSIPSLRTFLMVSEFGKERDVWIWSLSDSDLVQWLFLCEIKRFLTYKLLILKTD